MRFPRAAAAVAAVALVTVACSNDGGEAGAPASPPATPPAAGGPATGAPTSEAPLDPALGDVSDGVFRGQGIVLPLPEGWRLDQAGLAQGVVGALPEGQQSPTSFLLGVAGINETPGTQFEGLGLDEAVASYRELAPVEPTVDEEIELAGAERAHQLKFENLEVGQEEGQPPTDQLIILGVDSQGRLGLLNYIAPSGGFETAIADRLRSEGGLDPDSDPVRPEAPGPAPTGEPTGPAPTGEPTGDGATDGASPTG